MRAGTRGKNDEGKNDKGKNQQYHGPGGRVARPFMSRFSFQF